MLATATAPPGLKWHPNGDRDRRPALQSRRSDRAHVGSAGGEARHGRKTARSGAREFCVESPPAGEAAGGRVGRSIGAQGAPLHQNFFVHAGLAAAS
jgi:hypothetical protein